MGEKPTGMTEEEEAAKEGDGTSDTGGGAGIVRRPDGTIRKQTAGHIHGTG